jgi:hypothetical protein
MRFLPILVLASCVAPTGDPREGSFDIAGALENAPDWLVHAVPGDSYSGRLTTCHPAEASPTLGCMGVYLLDVEPGESVIVALEPGAQLRPELLIKRPDYTLVAHATEQTLYADLPAAAPFAVLGEGTYVVFVSGEGYASGGDYEIHFTSLERALGYPLATDDSTIGIVTDDLRDLDAQPNRERIVEKGDGFVEIGDQLGVALEERAALLRLVDAINEDRKALFELVARRAEHWVDADSLRIVAGDWLRVRAALGALP